MRESDKKSGVLLHISSLPGKYGIGTLGKAAYKFVDFLEEAGFSYWEVLPLGTTSISNSPFQSLTTFGLNHYFIDYGILMDEGLLNIRDFQGLNFGNDPRKVDYRKVFANNSKLLTKAFKRFDKNNEEFNKLKKDEKYRNYALYMTLKEKNKNKAWYDWELRDRFFSKEVEDEALETLEDRFDFYIFTQYEFLKQWKALKTYANNKNIKIIGQIPHFVGFDCDYVYIHPELFLLDEKRVMKEVVGFPPDDFTKLGQVWGNPLYNWNYMQENGYKFRKERINQALELFDMVKVNHFGGFYKSYAIPFREKNGKRGKFIYGPGLEIFKDYKDAPLFADDIGSLTKDIQDFVTQSNYPHALTIIASLFRFKKTYERYLPSELNENCLAYIGTHDNLPLRPRIERCSKEELEDLISVLKEECEKENISYDDSTISTRTVFINVLKVFYKSNAKYTTLMMQDILYQGEESRMNKPGTHGNSEWAYRFLSSDLTPKIIDNIKKLNIEFNRNLKK